MAVGIVFNGQLLIRPQAVSMIDDSAMFGRGLGASNTLAIIGESSGGVPQEVQFFTDPSYATSILGSGPLLDAIQRAYDPSNEISGAYTVAAIRVNPAIQATLTMTDASSNPLILLTSVDYGIWNNQIKARLEAGSTVGTYKFTDTYGASSEQGDNIQLKSLYFTCSDPKVISAQVTVEGASGLLITAITSYFQTVFGNATDVTVAASAATNWYLAGTNTSLTPTIYIYVGSDQPFNTINFTPGTAPNTTAANMVAQYWNGNVWHTITVVDGTKGSSLEPFSTAGNITYVLPTDWGKTTVNAKTWYWMRLSADQTLLSGAQGSTMSLTRGLSVTLADYPTIQQLSDYLDAQSGYQCSPATSSPTTDLSANLDDVLNSSIITATTVMSGGYNPSTNGNIIPVDTSTGFNPGDYIAIVQPDATQADIRKVTATGTGTITVNAALATTYVVGSVINDGLVLDSNIQAIINWINTVSSYVTATFSPSAINRAQPRLFTDTYLKGGTDGTTAQSDWDTALNTLQNQDTPLVTCVSYDPAVWAALSAHCEYMSSYGKHERIGFCGGFAIADGYTNGLGRWNNTTNVYNSIQQMLIYAQQLNSDRMVYVGPGFSGYNANGLLTTYPGSISAALVAGMAAGVDVATALTHTTINVIGLEYNFKWSDLDQLLLGGVCPLEYEPSIGYRVCQSITTWLANDRYDRREMSVRRTADYVARQVRERLEEDFVGKKGTLTTLISIKNATISVLQQMYRAEYLAGDANNPPYKNIQCRLVADTCYVDFECSPVIPINYIPITVHLTVYTATVTG